MLRDKKIIFEVIYAYLRIGVIINEGGFLHMKIKKVKALPLIYHFDKPVRTGVATFYANYATIVRVSTDTEIEGVGECLARYSPEIWVHLVEDILSPLIINEDPFNNEWIWEKMYRNLGSFSGHSKGMLLEAISGIDIALWDIMGKETGKPIYKLLGGFNRKWIDAYGSAVSVDIQENMVFEAQTMVDKGFKAIKVKIGTGVNNDIQVLKAIRKAVGDDISIMADANCSYRYSEAARLARDLEELDIKWLEEPLRTEDMNGYKKLRQNSIIPLACGEGEFTRYGIWEFLNTGVIDIVQPDVVRSGGITETRKIAIIASLYNAMYAPHVGGSGAVCAAASVHLAASMSNFLTYECSYHRNPLRDDIVKEPVGHSSLLENGKLPVPDRPGLGIELNEKVVEKYLVK